MKTPKWKRLLSLVLTVAMVFGLVSMNTFATEGQKSGSETIMVLDTAPSSAETTVGGLYTLDLDTVFSDTSGHSMTYTISGGNFSEHTKIANGTFYFTESTAGTYEPTITATCSEGAEVSHTITITVAEGDAGLKSQYGYDETPADKVTVYITINNDGMPLLGNDTDQTVLAHAKITVPYFDLALYGLEKFYRYGTENGSGEYINDEVVQRPTALHLYIYLLERYYMGLSEDKCCKGSSGVMEYAEKNDVLYMNGETAYTAAFDALNITGSATSLYMQQFWGHDENLMYYRNHVYPLMSPGWGSTCDYILLSDGDTIDVAMFTDWSFWSDGGGFTKFDKDNYTGEAGSTLTVQTLQFGTRSVADGGIDDFLPVTDMIVGLYDESWQRISAVNGTEGSYTLTLPAEPGTYYLLGTDADAATEDARLAAATAEITVTFPEHQEQDEDGDNICDICGQVINHAPVVAENAATAAEAAVGTAWEQDLSTIFSDADGDELTYTATVNDTEQTLTGSVLSYTPEEAGEYTVVVTASDGKESVSHTITLTAAVQNRVPVLKEGVSAAKEDTTPVGYAYNLTELQYNEIFEDPDGDELDYTCYYYQRSADGGETWGEEQHFEPSLFGFTTIQFTETVAGTYIYRFRAYDGKGYSEDTWTLTLHVSDDAPLDFTFYVGRDQNYSANGKKYPEIKLYKTAGFDENLYDYVGYYLDDNGARVYVYNPADYEITESEGVYYADGRQLYDYVPITFTNSLFGAEGEDALESGALVTVDYTEYSAYYASMPAGRYSYRAYGYNTETEAYDIYLGGQPLNLPTEANVDGGTGGGTDIYLRLISIYTTSKKIDNTSFTVDDYYIEVTMPIMGGMVHSGTPYVSGSTTRYPFMMYAAGNASLYNIYAYPTDTDNYIFSQSINQTTAAGNTAQTKTIAIGTAITLTATAPADADFGLYFQYNNFNTKEVEPTGEWVINGDTKTASFKMTKGSSNYTWRLSDDTHATRAGWLKNISSDTELSFDFEGASEDKISHDSTRLGSVTKTRDEADILVNLDASGFEQLSGTTRVRAYRHWEIINNDAGNIMVEPDFHWTLESGDASIDTVDGGNTADNWADITPGASDSIVSVYYDAIEMNPDDYGTHGGLFPATNPERVGVIVIPGTETTVGTADADVDFNMASGGTTTRSMDWDYNGDTWFYLADDETPALDFAVNATGDVTVQTAFVTANDAMETSVSEWAAHTASDGVYHVDLSAFNSSGNGKGGTVIIKMTDTTGTSYRLVRVAKITIEVTNVTNPGEPLMPGDQAKLTFDGMYRNINKTSGIFNPTNLYVRYTNGETEYSGTLGQYQQMDNVNFTITIPEDIEFPEGQDTIEWSLTNGYIFGSMYSAANPFGTIYQMTDTGVGTNFNAVTVNFYSSHVPDTAIEVSERVFYDVALEIRDSEGAVDGCTVTVKDPSGAAVEPNAETGLYEDLIYGEYSVVISKAGYLQTIDSFKLGSADAETAVDGKVTRTFTIEKAAEGAWDGTTVTEPAADENGVYQIGTGAELAWFAQTVNAGTNTISAVLIADIDLARYFWTPIGNNTNNFKGNFDGAGHTVKNMAISYTTAATTSPYQGLFGFVCGTSNSELIEIKDLTVEGALVLNNGKSVYGANSGGIVGQAKYAKLSSLTSDVDVTLVRTNGNWQHIGGVVGYLDGGSMINCANLGDVTGYNYVGGIVGFADYGCVIDGCYNSGSVSGYQNIGGIAGNLGMNGDTANEITNTVQNCYNTGSVASSYRYAGGLIGYMNSSTNTEVSASILKNSYSTGTVIASNNYAGAVVANITKAAVCENVCYLDSACSAAFGNDAGTHSATAKTSEELKSAAAALGESFTTDAENINDGYPILRWQAEESVIYGDVDGDGKINSADAALIYRVVNGGGELTEEQLQSADVNGDGKINAIDAAMIYSYVNGKISSFSVENN